jgi:hypothetical protein
MERTYKLKLVPKTLQHLRDIRKKYKVKVSVGPIQDFDLNEFGIDLGAPGLFFSFENQTYIYVSNRQSYKSGHDYIVLHEIAHLLMHRYDFEEYTDQEEAYANGYALSVASDLGISIDKHIIKDMNKYSQEYFKRYYKKKRK